ncbi:MAG: peptidoglycan-binding protein [Oscillospiraceae bacterium]|nr:peptidoglycan-binding protein [Oscillospiraceae bacterium]
MRTITKTETAVRKAIALAEDNSHGYSQASRWGPDYDCSSMVCQVFEEAGIPLKTCGGTYTGNMLMAALKAGFIQVPLAQRKRGDILLRHTSGSDGHTAIYLGSGMLVHAAGTYGHPESGDQSGNEICIQNYYDAGWQYCLRFPEEEDPDGPADDDIAGSSESTDQASQSSLSSDSCCGRPVDPKTSFRPVSLPVLKNGDTGPSVIALQLLLEVYGFSVGQCGVDGEFGPDTEKALRTMQSVLGIQEDGKTGEKTWRRLLKGE